MTQEMNKMAGKHQPHVQVIKSGSSQILEEKASYELLKAENNRRGRIPTSKYVYGHIK